MLEPEGIDWESYVESIIDKADETKQNRKIEEISHERTDQEH